jgi:hypothetical protein
MTRATQPPIITSDTIRQLPAGRALRTETQKVAQQGPLYFDLSVSLSKSISVFYASLGEHLRQAQLADDQAGAEYWAGLIAEVDEMIHAANQAGMEYFEQPSPARSTTTTTKQESSNARAGI